MPPTGPRFIDSPSLQVFPPPSLCQDVTQYVFFLKADPDRLQTLCDTYLNRPTGGAVDYRPLGRYVMLSFQHIGRLSSTVPEFRDRGFTSEREATFWVPVGDFKKHGPVQVLERAEFFIPYIYTDNPWAVAGGREIYGFPKQLSTLVMPEGDSGPDAFEIHTLAFPTFGPDKHARMSRVLSLRESDGTRPVAAGREKSAGEEWVGRLARSEGGGLVLPGFELMRQFTNCLARRALPMVFLKQFRDVGDSTGACYQAIVGAAAERLEFKSIRPLPRGYTLSVTPLASQPIAEELGLRLDASGQLPLWGGLRLECDFVLDRGQVLWSNAPAPSAPALPLPRKPRKKVAVLGGGAAALTTAYYLSHTPELREEYEVTVYQLGWRLGGKGASGRGPHGRIEEHGLHVFWGFYENAFALMRSCYEEMDRPPTMPLATFEQAFLPNDLVAIQEHFQGQWQPWVIRFPTNNRKPGEDSALDSPRTVVEGLLGALKEVFRALVSNRAEDGKSPGWLPAGTGTLLLGELDRLAYAAMEQLSTAALTVRGLEAWGLTDTLRGFLRRLRSRVEGMLGSNFVTYQLFVGVDFLTANLVGILEDRLLQQGFNSIEEHDYRAWLEKHGASNLTLRSSLTRTIYDAAMSFVEGDPERQSMGAGSALRALLRIGLTYQGHVMYKFAASMGDTVFVPLYEACRKNGVRFEFFHRVEELIAEPDASGGPPRVTRIRVGRQVDLKDPDAGYQPFVHVKNLPCWPSQPLHDQLVQGEQLLRDGVDLESFYTRWRSVSERVLEHGTDFDHVVFGIPVAAVPFLCPTLLELNPAWKRMVDGVATVQSQAFQLWSSRDLKGLGWKRGNGVVLSTFVEPVDTWADMSELLPREGWAQPNAPRNLAYFCGAMPGPSKPPPPTDHDFPAREREKAKRNALDYLRNDLGVLFPEATRPNARPEYDWTLLVPSNGGKDEARFDTQYWRANVDPSERYTLALPGTAAMRIKPGETGFANLTITGDWVDNGFYAGAVEGAVISGLQAFRAVTGQPLRILGEAWYR